MNQSDTEHKGFPESGTSARDAFPQGSPGPAPYGYPPLKRKSPFLAGLFSLMPGLGQIYVGYYLRGFVHAGIFASVVALLDGPAGGGLEPLLGIFLGFFYLYNVIDAVRLASLYNDVMQSGGKIPEVLPKNLPSPGGSLFGGIILVGLGFLFLLNTLFEVSLAWLSDWWPMIPVLFGIYLIQKGIQERRERGEGS
ncbi:MAG: hypothetical protein GF346_08870 [Candidatus Eisenbacteria bacterium]|nr:hypothetical protein [Candidatus Latescibacterota bacterium]MBD3302545.1 hypothetical protein [Candidatus Eisenbacteria bacterium]